MRNYSFISFLGCLLWLVNLQSQDSTRLVLKENSKYLEDQFYAGLAYIVLLDRPNDVIQRNLSYGVQLGFIKDIPLNRKRNFGVGLGLGYGTNSYFSNIIAEDTEPNVSYRLAVEADALNRTKFETHAIEFPFELRWRTSNAQDYKFWRIYAGLKAAYLFSRKSKFVSENTDNISFQNNDISQWQYG
jgi:hypothetical protein